MLDAFPAAAQTLDPSSNKKKFEPKDWKPSSTKGLWGGEGSVAQPVYYITRFPFTPF